MLNDTINTLIFEFTCSSEEVAITMRNEIVNYSASQINTILSDVLKRKFNNSLVWKIDKLEIDLGTIYLDELNTENIVLKFKNKVNESIEESLQKETHSGVDSLLETEVLIDIIKTLLLKGDLPWWIDKNTFTSFDQIINSVLNQNKEELKAFLKGQTNNRDVKHRIKMYSSPKNFLKLNKLVPEITDTFVVDRFATENEKLNFEKLSGVKLQQIVESLNKRITSNNHNIKLLLIQELLKNPDNLLPGIKLLDVQKGNELAGSELMDSKKAIPVLMHLSAFQLEFLLHSPLLLSGKTEEIPSTEAIGNFKNERNDILYIFKKLRTANQNLLNQLNGAPEKSLKLIIKSFKQLEKQSGTKRLMVTGIIENPNFLRYILPWVLAKNHVDFPSAKSNSDEILNLMALNQRFHRVQSHMGKVLKNLTIKQTTAFNKVISTGKLYSTFTKKTLDKVLNSMSAKDLQLISSLVLLNKNEIESILPEPEIETSGNHRKTIIENAGLCILAPYLPTLFTNLGFIDKGKFKTKAQAHRALYLLQYIVNCRQQNYEYVLQLNKLLCGLKLDESISAYKRLTVEERNEADDLIDSVISHWKALKSTSKKGFQLSFLQRKGILTEREELWTLQVEKSAYDLLLDSIPWSFNMIKLPWMNKMIQVEW